MADLKYWAFTDRVLFLEYSRLDKQNMSFSRNGVRIWNKLANEILQMPKEKFKRNIYNYAPSETLGHVGGKWVYWSTGFEYALHENWTQLILSVLSFQLLM